MNLADFKKMTLEDRLDYLFNKTQEIDCPFGVPTAQLEHPTIGECSACGAEAKIQVNGSKLCFPCGYDEANRL